MKLNLHKMTTETRNQSTWNLDTMTPLEVVTAMNQEDAKVPQAIAPPASPHCPGSGMGH